MSGRALLLSVRFHDGRYHGSGPWPPSPARLFQALVAAAGSGGPLAPEDVAALEWLERAGDPLVAAPAALRGSRATFFVPNNDLERVGGDLARSAALKAAKPFWPWCFDPEVPVVYVWRLDSTAADAPAQRLCALAQRLYQLGRGIDLAWAWGEVVEASVCDERLASYPGIVYQPTSGDTPSAGDTPLTLNCPRPGSLESLRRRHAAFGARFRRQAKTQVWAQPPPVRFAHVPYGGPPAQRLFELRRSDEPGAFAAWPLTSVQQLIEQVRDLAAARLARALPHQAEDVRRSLIGKRPQDPGPGLPAQRVRLIPLPSIGDAHADRDVRRLLLEVPVGCPLRADDVAWALTGLEVPGPDAASRAILAPAPSSSFLRHFGSLRPARTWRTVTPAALPALPRSRGKPAAGPAPTQAVLQALRHAGVYGRVVQIRAQREPFEAKTPHAEHFARPPRFPPDRLWHLELTFAETRRGPLVLGDGRFLGLGVLAPHPRHPGQHAFAIRSGLAPDPDPLQLARALRRAVLARVQQELQDKPLQDFFTGHAEDGGPARSGGGHLLFAFDPPRRRLLVLAPHVLERRPPRREEEAHLAVLDRALAGLTELRAGVCGRLVLEPQSVDEDADPLWAPARSWESLTPYCTTRHRRLGSAAACLEADLGLEAIRRGLPQPRASVLETWGAPRLGLCGRVRLEFDVAVAGPLLLGRTRHLGGGLFGPAAHRP